MTAWGPRGIPTARFQVLALPLLFPSGVETRDETTAKVETSHKVISKREAASGPQITYKKPPHWRRSSLTIAPPKGERDASHDPPLALSHTNGSDPRPARKAGRRRAEASQPVCGCGSSWPRERRPRRIDSAAGFYTRLRPERSPSQPEPTGSRSGWLRLRERRSQVSRTLSGFLQTPPTPAVQANRLVDSKFSRPRERRS